MSSPRRDFLRKAGAATLVAAGLTLPASAEPFAEPHPEPYPEQYPEPHPEPLPGPWDLSWTSRVTGRFRAVFDSPDVADGSAIFRAMVWCDEYKTVYGTPRADMSPVIVLRHRGLRLALNDAYWKRFELGKDSKVLSPEGKEWAEANPVLTPDHTVPEPEASYTLPKFISDGGIVLGCGLAFEQVVGRLKKADSLSDSTARERAHESLVPGVILQPSGIFATLRAQEAGCKYILAS